MAEGNGDRDSRMDRIAREHEEFRADLKQLLIAQVIQKDQIDQLLKVTQEQTRQLEAEASERRAKDATLDARVDKLVSAIGELVSRMPARG
jgi:septal ring factor EnvC (AmiA/AmiB activator)